MRLKYYTRLFGQMYVRKSFVLILFFVLVVSIVIICCIRSVTPVIEVACQSKAKAVALQVTEETVKEFLNNVEYDSLINLAYNSEGKIVGIHANIIQLRFIVLLLIVFIKECTKIQQKAHLSYFIH